MAHRPRRSEAGGDSPREQQSCWLQGGRRDEVARGNSARESWQCRSTIDRDLSDMSDAADGARACDCDCGGGGDAQSLAQGEAAARGGVQELEGERWVALDEHQRKQSEFESEQRPAPGGVGGCWSQRPADGGTGLGDGKEGASTMDDESLGSEALAAECKPAALPTPLSSTAQPPKLPRIMGWSNSDALRGTLPKPQSTPSALPATVDVGRMQSGPRPKSGALRSVAASYKAAAPLGHRKLCRDDTDSPLSASSELVDAVQSKIDSAEGSWRRGLEVEPRDARCVDGPDSLADRLQHKIDSADWGRPPRVAALALSPHSDGYFDGALAAKAQQKTGNAHSNRGDDLASRIQRKIDRAGWTRPRDEAPHGLVARFAGKLDTLAGRLVHKMGRARWDRQLSGAVDSGSGRREGSDALADRIQRKIDREGWGRQAGGTKGERARDASAGLAKSHDKSHAASSKHQRTAERHQRALAPLAPAVSRGKVDGELLFAAGDDQQLQTLDRKPRRMDGISSPSELKIIIDGYNEWAATRGLGDNEDVGDDGHCKPSIQSPRDAAPAQSELRVSEALTHLVVFASTATLHCGVFAFSSPVRRALSLEAHPFGIVLLVCWAIEGLTRCVGGVLGDLAADRVVLLRRAALLWALAVLLLLADAAAAIVMATASTTSSLSSTLAGGILCVAFVLAACAHGVVVPNMVALGAQAALRRNQTQAHSLFNVSTPKSSSPRGSMSMTRVFSEVGEEEDAAAEREDPPLESQQATGTRRDGRSTTTQAHARLCVNRYYSASFAATTAGSSLVQVIFMLTVEDVSAASPSSSSSVSFLSSAPASVSLRAVILLGIAGAVLLAALGAFARQSRGCRALQLVRGRPTPGRSLDERFRRPSVARWLRATHGSALVVVGYALCACTALLIAGAASAVVILAAFPRSALAARLSPLLTVMATWLVGMAMASQMLKAVTTRLRRPSGEASEEDTATEEADDELSEADDELPEADEHQRDVRVQFALALLALGGALACAAFVRGQLYSTVAAQLCQANAALPSALGGSAGVSLRPEVAGGAVGLSSVLLLVLLTQLDCSSASAQPTAGRSRWSWPRLASASPATRMAVAAALSLIGLFLASVVELYRRRAPLLPAVAGHAPSRQCAKPAADLSLLWSAPALVVLGAADALFRLSLHEQAHVALLPCRASDPCSRWAGRVLGALAFAEALGNAAALALVAALAPWLLGQAPSDLTLVFLLLTTALALTFVLLKSVGRRVARVAAVAAKRAASAPLRSTEATAATPMAFERSDEAARKLAVDAEG